MLNREVYHPAVRLILASASPRRRELLAAAGYEFDVEVAAIDERRTDDEAPDAYVDRMARLKAACVAAAHPDRLVLGADTVVVADGDVLGKPADSADAARMLRRLNGRAHDVFTGVAIVRGAEQWARVERTRVWMAPLSEADLGWYVASGEPLDKAGAYGIQGLASRFISRIDGAYGTVVGLPVATVAALLGRATGLSGVASRDGPPGPVAG